MAKVSFAKLNLKVNEEVKHFTYEGNKIEIKQYLPQAEKANFVRYVFENSIDEKTNTFSPIRIETYFGIALVKWYSNISFTEKQLEDIVKTYDKLESSNLLHLIQAEIPEHEYDYIESMVYDTIDDYERFANSFVGMISAISSDASDLNQQINDIMNKIQNKEGLEELAAIKDIVG